MSAILAGIIFGVVLSAGILVLLQIGRRVGVRRTAEEGETASKGLSAIEGAIFGLLGLILAFLFSGALTRFDAARHLVVEEANDIGTASLRIALLPADAQPSMRDLFRRYLDSRIEVYRQVPNIPDMEAIRAALAGSTNLQSEIWALAVSSSREAGTAQAPMLLLPALNAMFDIATTRTEATRLDPPMVIQRTLSPLRIEPDHQHVLTRSNVVADRQVELRRDRDTVNPSQLFLSGGSTVATAHGEGCRMSWHDVQQPTEEFSCPSGGVHF